jgi:hypothetical protein
MAPLTVARRALGMLVLAMLSVGCGTASTHTSSPTASTPAPATTQTPAGSAAAAVPAGWARYVADGFSFVAPGGFKLAPDGRVGGLPSGVSLQFLTPGGRRLASTNTQIMVGINPHLGGDLDAVATGLEAADANSRSLTHVKTNISTMTVPGAQDVRIVSESYVGPGGGKTRTLFRRTWLMVLPKPGTLLELVVVDEPQRGGRLDPAGVLDSFRLEHAA